MKVQVIDEVTYTLKDNHLSCEAFTEKKSVLLDGVAKDFCVGRYGDGCGGGHVFVLYEDSVKAYDIEYDRVMMVIDDLKNTKSITKDGCVLNINTEDGMIHFNLSTLTKEDK